TPLPGDGDGEASAAPAPPATASDARVNETAAYRSMRIPFPRPAGAPPPRRNAGVGYSQVREPPRPGGPSRRQGSTRSALPASPRSPWRRGRPPRPGQEPATPRPCRGPPRASAVPGCREGEQPVAVLEALGPLPGPGGGAVVRAGERAGEGRDGGGVAGGAGGAADRGERVAGQRQEAVQAGGERLLGRPARTGREAGVGLEAGGGERGLQAVERGEALVPAAGEVRRGVAGPGAGGEVAEPGGVVDGAGRRGVLAQRGHQAGGVDAVGEQPYRVGG